MLDEPRTWSGAPSLGTSATSPATIYQLNVLIIAFKVNLRNYIRGIAWVGHLGNRLMGPDPNAG
jgi:hypothetical protein